MDVPINSRVYYRMSEQTPTDLTTNVPTSAKPPRGRRIVDPVHKRAIVSLLAAFVDSPTKISKLLADPDYAARHGFEAIEVSVPRVCQIIQETSPLDVAKERAEYLIDFSEIPFAHTKERVRELAKLYSEVDATATKHGRRFSALGRMKMKLRILSQIASEMDESMEKLAEAIKTSNRALSLSFTKSQIVEIAYVLQSEIEARIEEEK